MAESALAGGLDPGTRGDRYQVVVHVDAEALPAGSESGASCLAGGAHVSAETARRLACDAARVAMRHAADGRALSVGRRTRAISPGLRRALEHRDRGCRFPGCGATLCDAHHVRHWADGGETSLANTVLLCRRHHRAVHEEGYSMELGPGGEARFHQPDGRPLPQAPPAPLTPASAAATAAGEPAAVLTSWLMGQGVTVAAGAASPDWWGESVDYGWEIEWLQGAGARMASAGSPGAPSAL